MEWPTELPRSRAVLKSAAPVAVELAARDTQGVAKMHARVLVFLLVCSVSAGCTIQAKVKLHNGTDGQVGIIVGSEVRWADPGVGVEFQPMYESGARFLVVRDWGVCEYVFHRAPPDLWESRFLVRVLHCVLTDDGRISITPPDGMSGAMRLEVQPDGFPLLPRPVVDE